MFKVLVVDDDPVLRYALTLTLEGTGKFKVTEAVNGEEGLVCLASDGQIRAIITDFKMPIMDGLELINKVRATGSKIPILMVSSDDSAQTKNDSKKIGATAFMSKTNFSPENLLAWVETHLQMEG
ncbi:MAG: response regulator [Nitrospinae bacterium]|nr:response regulator [Nitrospinota bacterium]